MPIILPPDTFDGSDLNLNYTPSSYIKEGVPKAVFSKSVNKEGAYVVFLPCYKADERTGAGVWYKKIIVRDNFGTNFKEKYYVPDRSADPAEYFATNFRALYPDKAKPVEQEGKPFKKFPFYGRLTERVLYNVAFAKSLHEGPRLLDLPLRNGADSLMNWLQTADASGRKRGAINNPDHCFPVFIQLKESQNPWFIQVDASQTIRLPDDLANSEKLIHLDNILVTKTKEEIISKLQEMYPEVFDRCMEGFPGLLTGAVPSAYIPPQAPVQQPQIPVFQPQIPQHNVQHAPRPGYIPEQPQVQLPTLTAPAVQANLPGVADISSLPANPMSSGTRMSREEALKFINQ